MRSASRTPSPRRGPLEERGGPLVASSSKASAIAASDGRATAAARPGPADAGRDGTPAIGHRPARARGPRTTRSAIRVGSSRRAASSSSATSGRPADRSTTTTRTLADGRSPSIDSMSRASSSRASGPSVRRAGGRGAPSSSRQVRAPRGRHVGARRPGTCRRSPGAGPGRSGPGTSTSVRVPASARWRSSTTSRTGRRSPSRPTTPRTPSSSRAWRRSGTVVSAGRGATPSPLTRDRARGAAGRAHRSAVPTTARELGIGQIGERRAAALG